MIEIKNLTIKYKNTNKTALENISFDIGKGEVVVLLGPSGCGKTTLLSMISGLLSEEDIEKSGQIKMDAMTVRTVFQSPTLLPWRNVRKNIAFGLETLKVPKNETEEKVSEIMDIVGLSEFEKYYPHQLSIGMRQRVNFGRALACEPQLLLLDEPFSALDITLKKKLQKAFLKIIREKNITSIFVTHSIEEALEIGDKIFVFFDGKLVKRGFYKNKFNETDKKHLYLNMANYLEKC